MSIFPMKSARSSVILTLFFVGEWRRHIRWFWQTNVELFAVKNRHFGKLYKSVELLEPRFGCRNRGDNSSDHSGAILAHLLMLGFYHTTPCRDGHRHLLYPHSPLWASVWSRKEIEQVWHNPAIAVYTWMYLSQIASVRNRISHCCILSARRKPYL